MEHAIPADSSSTPPGKARASHRVGGTRERRRNSLQHCHSQTKPNPAHKPTAVDTRVSRQSPLTRASAQRRPTENPPSRVQPPTPGKTKPAPNALDQNT